MRTPPVTERGDEVLPIHFGLAAEELFGCYHAPAAARARDVAIVLCYPLGQEYIRAHRSFVMLARRLAKRGFPVLRFDYYGSGDSAGDVEDGRVRRWLEDISAAIDEARRRAGARRVSLVGLRLGASLAALTAIDRDDVDTVVLWDPIIDGRACLDELTRFQADLLRYEYVTVQDAAAVVADEVLGFPMPAALRAQLGELDLTALPRPPASRVLLVESGRPVGLERLQEQLEMRCSWEHRHIPGPKIWLMEALHGIVPNHVLEHIVAWIEQELT
jgi:uncharacterized protein